MNAMIFATSGKQVAPERRQELYTYEQLRETDSEAIQLKTSAVQVIAEVFGCRTSEVKEITVLKKGMTNRSFRFCVDNKRYILRIPGEGTEHLIDRGAECKVYNAIKGKNLCDEPFYINPINGYKITGFIENAHVCDVWNWHDVSLCMKKLRYFHSLKLSVPQVFDIYERIEFYESLWGTEKSAYDDYGRTKRNVLSLRDYVEKHRPEYQLTHIDAVCDNFLFDPVISSESEMAVQLTDWEYSGMQDPHVDIAMFGIYALYNKTQMDKLINIYFREMGGCMKTDRIKIYCYIALCGLLWSNWCEYKRNLGAEFGEYSLRQYEYAKDYYQYAKGLM